MKRRIRRAFTLIEVVIAGVILLLVIGVAMALFIDANRNVGQSLQLTDAAVAANKLEALLREQLRDAGQFALGATNAGAFVAGDAGLSPNGDFTSVQFRKVDGFDTAANPPVSTFGVLHEIRFTYDPGEGGAGSGNDADDDGDGRIDEGFLTLFIDDDDDGVMQADEEKAVLAVRISGDDFAFRFASGLQSDQPNDLNLQVTFTVVLRPIASLGTADGTNGETRTLTIPLRNK